MSDLRERVARAISVAELGHDGDWRAYLNETDAAIAEVLRWLPMETAPRTTKTILVWCPERQNTHAVYWRDGKPEGWCFAGSGVVRVVTEEPTDWMTLPPPPAEGGEG